MNQSEHYSLAGKRVWVAGHKGMVGGAIVRRLRLEKCEIVGLNEPRIDLRRQSETENLISRLRPDAIVLAAAKVGGILANSRYPADYLYDNLLIEANIIQSAYANDVSRMLFLGSSCIYPKFASQPISEDALLTGPLEPTNEWYAMAKIAGIKLAQAYRRQHGLDYISAMPTNLYGPGDNFDLETSHVIPALIRKAHIAKENGDSELVVWGTGSPRREFLHSEDCADALVFLLKTYSAEEHVNVGSGEDLTILDLTKLVCEVVGFEGHLVHDLTKADGTPRKLMSGQKLRNMGWAPKVELRDGVAQTYQWFLSNVVRT